MSGKVAHTMAHTKQKQGMTTRLIAIKPGRPTPADAQNERERDQPRAGAPTANQPTGPHQEQPKQVQGAAEDRDDASLAYACTALRLHSIEATTDIHPVQPCSADQPHLNPDSVSLPMVISPLPTHFQGLVSPIDAPSWDLAQRELDAIKNNFTRLKEYNKALTRAINKTIKEIIRVQESVRDLRT